MAFETLARILQLGHFDQTDVEQHFFPLLRIDFSRSFITQVPHRLPQMCLPHLPAADPAAWEQISFLSLWVWAIEVTLHHLCKIVLKGNEQIWICATSHLVCQVVCA